MTKKNREKVSKGGKPRAGRTRGLLRFSFFIAQEIIKVSAPSEDEEKSTAEYAETAELLLGKDKKHKSFYGYGLLFAFRSSGDEDKRMNEEEAESAERVP
jgi:hypothetical protein